VSAQATVRKANQPRVVTAQIEPHRTGQSVLPRSELALRAELAFSAPCIDRHAEEQERGAVLDPSPSRPTQLAVT
jgi:hypothetical protein